MSDGLLDLVSVGAWTLFDHIFRMSTYPEHGATVTLDMPITQLEQVYYGDCSANVAAVAARLGLRVGLGMVVGEDFATSGYQEYLQGLGIELSGVEIVPAARSGHSYLYFDHSGDGFCLSHLGVAVMQDGWTIPADLIRVARSVVVNEQFSAYTLAAIRRARAGGSLTAINGMVGTAGEQAPAFLEQADVLFIAEDELRALLRTLQLDAVAALQSWGPKLIFVTRGRHGSRLFTEDGQHDINIVPATTVVDTTGAGDAYAAGTLTALLKGHAPPAAAQFGAATASFVVEAWGCQTNLPTWNQITERLEM